MTLEVMTRTEDVASNLDLATLYEDDVETIAARQEPIQVCAGEWRREGDAWRFWLNND